MQFNSEQEVYEMNSVTKQIAESFHCPYQVFEAGTDPEPVEQAYMEALKEGETGGFWPAILLVDEYVEEWLGIVAQDGYDRDRIIAECGDNGREILTGRLGEYLEDCGEEFFDSLMGEETEGDELHHFIGYCSFHDGTLEADVLLLKLPVKNPWEIIGYLPMGGWNDCPGPEEMIAVCKYWYEKYGAVPAAFTHDVLEFYAPRGLNGADSLEVAKEHCAFCYDRVDQGTGTGKISELAAGLENSDVWYFWWD
jgi:hypothetical protein